ncbi:MAG: hypothetical protein BWK79_16020 [Beggiatoa sp. IS2]|nr:MAG: hypothetical protein BWK79_16020 [Beggiatoa sp. IS2]
MKTLSVSVTLLTASLVSTHLSTVQAYTESLTAVNKSTYPIASECNRWGQVNTDKDPLNIRAKPSQDARVVVKAPKGAWVCILGVHDDNWYKVSHDDITGYAASAYIKG